MLAVLLTAVLAQVPPAAIAPVTVEFGAAGRVTVPRPGSMGDAEATDRTFPSPRGDAAAVQFCWNLSTMSPLMCLVKLVRPGGSVLTLEDGAVGPLLWTPDGRYLIGAGNNTLRLWNLNGKVRFHTPLPPSRWPGGHTRTSLIRRTWLEGGALCVAALGDEYSAQRSPQWREVSFTTRFALPALRPLATASVAGRVEGELACPRASR